MVIDLVSMRGCRARRGAVSGISLHWIMIEAPGRGRSRISARRLSEMIRSYGVDHAASQDCIGLSAFFPCLRLQVRQYVIAFFALLEFYLQWPSRDLQALVTVGRSEGPIRIHVSVTSALRTCSSIDGARLQGPAVPSSYSRFVAEVVFRNTLYWHTVSFVSLMPSLTTMNGAVVFNL